MSTKKMCITHTAYKMIFLWTYCAVVFNLQLRMVLAGQITFGPKRIENWIEAANKRGEGENWFVNSNPETRLYTDIKQSLDGKEPGESWFVTPTIEKATNLSYINITALSDECDGKTSCNLTILGNKKSVSTLPVLVDRPYITTHFEPIETISFITKNPRQAVTSTVIIKKGYQRLCIITTPTKAETTWNIYSMKLYHNFCDQDGIDKLSLPNTTSSDGDISVTGNCSSNSISIKNKTTITVKCSPKGNWKVDKDQKCLCKKGFGLGSSKGCSRCLKNYYKADVADTECVKCPDGKTNNIMNTKCQCLEDRYIGEDENGPCYAVPSNVEGLEVKIYETFVNVSWQKPSDDGGLNDSLTYRVECYHCNQSNCDKEVENVTFNPGKTNLTTTSVKVYNLTTTERYKVRIVSTNSLNVPSDKWKYAEKKFTFKIPDSTTKPYISAATTGSSKESEDDNNMFIYIGIGAAFLVIVLLIIFFVFTKLRRVKTHKDSADNRGFDIALPTIGQRTYIDPSNYHDPEAAVREFANEISPDALILERVLGGGEFGDVYKGTLKTENGGVIEVAAKTLKYDSDERSRKDFFMEASAMGQFKDLNVIHLEGVITKSVPHMIVTEYMSNGSLDNFLKINDENLTDLQLVGMARGVASGMKYLAEMNFVHRDLAARNILVNEMLLCKVADFGLSRELETADSSRGEYCTTGGKIPVRWTAPEAIKYRKFSTASDVWSYGILLWEIMAFAQRPYWDWDNFKVLERIDEGYRLSAPKNCPKAVHELMLLCWDVDRSQRPQFNEIVRMLDDWIRSPETIRYEIIRRPASGVVSDPGMLIKEWLNDIKMSSYIPHFTQAGFTQLSDLAGLLDNDLQAIGISLIGHRNKMLRTIRTLPITDQSKKSPWNRSASLQV